MSEIESLSLFVGTGECNARCAHCAGLPLRKFAPKRDGEVDEDLIRNTVLDCYRKGARALSLSSSGEPTLSPFAVDRVLHIIKDLKAEGVSFPKINLYTNGIRIGTDLSFCCWHFWEWHVLGLTTVHLTVHSTDPLVNARVYGVPVYPPLERIIDRIHRGYYKVRINLLLNKNIIPTCDVFTEMIRELQYDLHVDSIAAWPLRDKDDRIDLATLPPAEEIQKMTDWLEGNPNFRVRFLANETAHEKSYSAKLTLFPDGSLTNTWCR